MSELTFNDNKPNRKRLTRRGALAVVASIALAACGATAPKKVTETVAGTGPVATATGGGHNSVPAQPEQVTAATTTSRNTEAPKHIVVSHAVLNKLHGVEIEGVAPSSGTMKVEQSIMTSVENKPGSLPEGVTPQDVEGALEENDANIYTGAQLASVGYDLTKLTSLHSLGANDFIDSTSGGAAAFFK